MDEAPSFVRVKIEPIGDEFEDQIKLEHMDENDQDMDPEILPIDPMAHVQCTIKEEPNSPSGVWVEVESVDKDSDLWSNSEILPNSTEISENLFKM